ncbi:MAG: type I secretion system permease/ATPase [Nitrospira sp.]|nr:type I secretion system permease/ATPase [Nitrospira sp.]
MAAATETRPPDQSGPIPASSASDESDTGLLSLLIIAQYYDLPADGWQLRHQFAQSGHKLSDAELLRAAKDLGLKAGFVTREWNKLYETTFPAMAKLLDGGYLVVVKVEDENVLVQNPAEGYSLVLPRDRFELIWTGELVIMTKRPKIRLQDLRFDMTWVIPGIVKYRMLFGEVLITSAFLQCLALLTPLLMQMVIDTVLVHKEFPTLSLLAGSMIALVVFDAVLGGLRTYLLSHTTNRMTVGLGAQLFRHMLALPLAYFDSRRLGDTVAHVRELEHLRRFVTNHSLTVLLDIPFAVLVLAVMWLISPTLALVVMLSLPVYALLFYSMTPSIRARLHDAVDREAVNQAFAIETISGIHTVKAMAVEPSFWRKWDAQLAGSVRASVQATRLMTTVRHVALGMRNLTTMVVIWVGAAHVIDGRLSIGQLIALGLLSSQVTGLMLRWDQLWQEFQQADLSVQRLGDMLNRQREPSYNPNRVTIPQVQGQVRFENVTFRYQPDGPTAIRMLSFSAEPGQIVGIVGRSGSGKSTIAKLLQCLYGPEQGRILVDGIDLAQVDPAWLRRHVGVVLQENVLFNGSVRNNIALADPEMAMEQVMQAATWSGAHEFIVELEHGYETLIGEQGWKLSSGQRQQIALARTLAANPRILIFDGAMNALDEESEQALQQHLPQIAQGRTVFILAHRLNCMHQAHRIYVLDKGEIIEQGSYEDLLERAGASAQLSESQTRN